MSAHEISPITQRQLVETRERVHRGLMHRELVAEGLFAASFLIAASLLAALSPGSQTPSLTAVAAMIVVYAAFAATPVPTGTGVLFPTQIALVPLLLLAPAIAPFGIALALALSNGLHALRGRMAVGRVVLSVSDAWFAIGPALVLVLGGADGGPDWADWPLYLAALGVQFLLDAVLYAARSWASLGTRPRHVVPELALAYRVDALLAPVGLVVAFAVADHPTAVLLVLPLSGLLRLLAREREARVDQTLELSSAYRGTALLLGDVIGEDDEYTGEHTQGVVELSLRVGDELGVDEETRRAVEFGALLHDIGKIAIPNSIINKPGKLDDAEWAVMKTHTVEGQRMLERVGGLLGRIGVVVRASHERWDGGGYPDGLVGEAIPLAARIVSACDAWNAMQTDRSYRKALPFEVAIDELHRNAGTQFDPCVVAALVAVAERDA
jgi:putative nucleotidyltransferase with HDIG domain